MKEQLVTFETAKLAKEKGFKLLTSFLYDEKGNLSNYLQLSQNYFINTKLDTWNFSAPSQSLLQKWLREKHKIDMVIQPYKNDVEMEDYIYCVDFFRLNTEDPPMQIIECSSYEDALEKTLQESLKLIPG